jgi:hypothetical protein
MRKDVYRILDYNEKTSEIRCITSIFDNGDGFKGVTGCILQPLTYSDVEDRNDVEYLAEFLESSGLEKKKKQTWEEFAEEILEGAEYQDTYFPFQDDSYVYRIGERKLLEFCEELGLEDIQTFECVGGGRIFNEEEERELFKELLENK